MSFQPKKKFGDRFDIVATNGEECSLFVEDGKPFKEMDPGFIEELRAKHTCILEVYSGSPI